MMTLRLGSFGWGSTPAVDWWKRSCWSSTVETNSWSTPWRPDHRCSTFCPGRLPATDSSRPLLLPLRRLATAVAGGTAVGSADPSTSAEAARIAGSWSRKRAEGWVREYASPAGADW